MPNMVNVEIDWVMVYLAGSKFQNLPELVNVVGVAQPCAWRGSPEKDLHSALVPKDLVNLLEGTGVEVGDLAKVATYYYSSPQSSEWTCVSLFEGETVQVPPLWVWVRDGYSVRHGRTYQDWVSAKFTKGTSGPKQSRQAK